MKGGELLFPRRRRSQFPLAIILSLGFVAKPRLFAGFLVTPNGMDSEFRTNNMQHSALCHEPTTAMQEPGQQRLFPICSDERL